MKAKKILIMVLATSNPNYKNLENSIKETWFNLKHEDVETIFYSDNECESPRLDIPVLKDNNLILPCNDGLLNIGHKTILAYQWLLQNYEFDYVYRSNLGAFVYADKIAKFLEDKPNENFYCGIYGKDSYNMGFDVEYVSGSGYFLSKDVVRKIVDNKEIWPHNAIDDVALGYLLRKIGVPIDKRATRLNFWFLDGAYHFDYNIGNKTVESIPEDDLYHIRLRSEDRMKDVEKMHEIYKKEIEKNNQSSEKISS